MSSSSVVQTDGDNETTDNSRIATVSKVDTVSLFYGKLKK